jgi:hypothetical protein
VRTLELFGFINYEVLPLLYMTVSCMHVVYVIGQFKFKFTREAEHQPNPTQPNPTRYNIVTS